MPDVTMNDNDSKTKEVKLNPPKPFDGKWENLKKFIQDGELYITINKKTYDDDIKKIGFFLLFMNEGDAASWKEQLLEDAMATVQANNTESNLGSYAHCAGQGPSPVTRPYPALRCPKMPGPQVGQRRAQGWGLRFWGPRPWAEPRAFGNVLFNIKGHVFGLI